ncbi:MAG: 16S rRNA (uracil(1498)-N(3))-methyltransferase [Methylococcales bacterium]|jgi:16S rRNA (uracil1498-N3)-methyltransferase|nr:16S rRNA (uracil(1498)-N(3))-methyltransferase [Methylococcales bacterium]MBT7444620.1 16S rRNA (uracil(1498)-N(3))-methyltransferase [Methylococcales bacterium]
MRVTRLYIDATLDVGQCIALNQASSHYLTTVLRAKQNHNITLFNGQGGEYDGTITTLHKRTSMISINGFTDISRESNCPVTLLQGISRQDRMDFSIQKATELGVQQIIPVFCQRSQKLTNPEKKHDHWQGIIISACEQSGRTQLPLLRPPQTLSETLQQPYDLGLFLDTTSTTPWHQITPKGINIATLIGPEGGFTEEEQGLIKEQQFQAISLGPRILRTETAALAAITLVMHTWGDLN